MITTQNLQSITGYLGAQVVCRFMLVFVLATSATFGLASAAVITPRAKTMDGIELHLEGDIQLGDAERLEANFEYAKASGLKVTAISLDSPGGVVVTGATMARSIRSRELRTVVGKNATCASACFMLFAAGKERIASEDARIGVHSAVTPKLGETDSAKSSTIDTARFLAELGVPSIVLGKMVTSKPSEMAWLTKEDLRLMKVNPIPGQIVPSSYVETSTPAIRRETLPPVTKPADSQSAQDIFLQAQSYIRAKSPQNAIELLKRATELDPYDPFIASTYGYALHLAGRDQDAREALQLGLQIKKNYAEGHRVLALVSAALGDSGKARDNFTFYYRTSARTDLAYSYLSDLAKSGQGNLAASQAARAALIQLNFKP